VGLDLVVVVRRQGRLVTVTAAAPDVTLDLGLLVRRQGRLVTVTAAAPHVTLDLGLLVLPLLVRHCSSFECFAPVVALSSL